MLNAQEQFVVMTITRADIAGWLNDYLEDHPDVADIPRFKEDDVRLSRGVCRHFAGVWASVLDPDLSEEERNDERWDMLQDVLVNKLGYAQAG